MERYLCRLEQGSCMMIFKEQCLIPDQKDSQSFSEHSNFGPESGTINQFHGETVFGKLWLLRWGNGFDYVHQIPLEWLARQGDKIHRLTVHSSICTPLSVKRSINTVQTIQTTAYPECLSTQLTDTATKDMAVKKLQTCKLQQNAKHTHVFNYVSFWVGNCRRTVLSFKKNIFTDHVIKQKAQD